MKLLYKRMKLLFISEMILMLLVLTADALLDTSAENKKTRKNITKFKRLKFHNQTHKLVRNMLISMCEIERFLN